MGSLFDDGKYSQWGNRFLPITDAYLEPVLEPTMEFFSDNSQRLNAVNYFRKNLHHRCSIGF